MTRLVWLDLCSGLGGASQPALDRGWRVIRVDIDARFRPDLVADIRALPLRPFHIDVLWASPPCAEFTRQSLPWFKGKYPSPSLDLVRAAFSVVKAKAAMVADRKRPCVTEMDHANLRARPLLFDGPHPLGSITRTDPECESEERQVGASQRLATMGAVLGR